MIEPRYHLKVVEPETAAVFDSENPEEPVYVGTPEEAEQQVGALEEARQLLWEDAVAQAVEAYAYGGTGRKGSPSIQARRIIAALRAIEVRRGEYRVRTEFERRTGMYGVARAHIYDSSDMAKIIKYARLMVRCSLTVYIVNINPGREHAWVTWDGMPRVVRLASAESRAPAVLGT